MDLRREGERFADLGEVTLCYDTFGDPRAPAPPGARPRIVDAIVANAARADRG